MSYAAAQYKSAKINTASPLQIVVALYDGAIRFLQDAEEALGHNEVGTRIYALNRAHAIVSELQATLDSTQSKSLCDELDRLYDFVLHRIQEATVRPQKNQLRPGISVLSTLREAWAQLSSSQAA